MRLWKIVRSADDIRTNRLGRLNGREQGLIAYWPLVEGAGREIRDFAITFDPQNSRLPKHDGFLGDSSHNAQPVWIERDLVLDPLSTPTSRYAYHSLPGKPLV